jgi:negative regulator of sigma E activity
MHNERHANSASTDERYLEALSTLLDGECPQSDAVMDETAADSQCRARWQSYHLIRDVMQNERHAALPANFASLVGEKIAAEQNIADQSADVVSFAGAAASRRQSRSRAAGHRPAAAPRWLPFAGLGLAASVAAAGLIGWQVVKNFDGPAGADLTVAQVTPPVAESPAGDASTSDPLQQTRKSGLVRAVYRGDTGTRWVAASGQHNTQVEQRLNSLLLNHLEDSSMTRVQGVAVHSRLVGYDTATGNDSF